jgi:hypothetical protein
MADRRLYYPTKVRAWQNVSWNFDRWASKRGVIHRGHLEIYFFLTFLSIRRALFGNLCLIHYLGVRHGNFDRWSVVRTDRGQLKIVKFWSADVSHVCPGWRECSELQSAWSQLQLDSDEN